MGLRRESLPIRVAILCGLAVSLTAQLESSRDPSILLHADQEQRAHWAGEWLRSGDPVRAAWGAWLARQDRLTGMIPLLIKKVGQYEPFMTVDRERHDALLSALDALIGLNADIPPEQAHRLYTEFPAQSLILLIRSPAHPQTELFDIFGKAKSNANWLAAGNALAKERTPEFAALLLSRFTQHLKVMVFDPNSGGNFGGGGGECGFSVRVPKAGWPLAGLYLLTPFPGQLTWLNATFLVNGETPVYYYRDEPGNYDNPGDNPGYCDESDRDKYRAQYLNALMKFQLPPISLDAYPELTIAWSSASGYIEKIAEGIAARRAAFRRAASYLLTPVEAERLTPRIEMVVYDRRTSRSTGLPPGPNNDRDVVALPAFTKPLY